MDVQGWITLTNNSGTPYVNADTLLVAGAVGGDPQDYRPPPAGADPQRRAPRPRAASGSAISTSIRCPSGPRSPTARPSRSASSTCTARRPCAPMNIATAGSARPSSRKAPIPCCASPARATRAWATRCRPAPSASTSATPAAIRNSSAKARSATRRWARSSGLTTGQAFDVKVRAVVERRERINDEPLAHDDALHAHQRPPERRSPST